MNTYPSESGWNQNLTSSPFSIKSLHHNSEMMLLWDSDPPFSWSAGFPNKVTIPCPSNLSLDLSACCGTSSSNLDSVIGSHLRNRVVKEIEELPMIKTCRTWQPGRVGEVQRECLRPSVLSQCKDKG